jgi:hypothetical protein
MNTNRSIDMGHVLKHCFIRDAKLNFESRLYILKRVYNCPLRTRKCRRKILSIEIIHAIDTHRSSL